LFFCSKEKEKEKEKEKKRKRILVYMFLSRGRQGSNPRVPLNPIGCKNQLIDPKSLSLL
jgi:hypothetical protein